MSSETIRRDSGYSHHHRYYHDRHKPYGPRLGAIINHETRKACSRNIYDPYYVQAQVERRTYRLHPGAPARRRWVGMRRKQQITRIRQTYWVACGKHI